MNFPKFLRLVLLPRHEHIKNSTTTVTRVYFDPAEEEFASLFAKMYKFSYELVSPSDGEIGRPLPNGNWSGMAGMLLSNEGDVVISILSMTSERMEFVDFSFPYSISPVTFITTKPEYSFDITAYLKPFAPDLWISLLAFLLIIPAIFLSFLKRRSAYGKLLLATFRSLLTQPLGIRAQNTKEYFLIFFYILGSGVFTHIYKCVLLSFIMVPTFTGVRTIDELAAAVTAGTYQCVTWPGTGNTGRSLLRSNDPNFRIIGENMLQNEGSTDILQVLRSSEEDSGRAFIAARLHFIPFKTKYFISQEAFFPLYYAMSMRKDFCCRELVTRFVMLMSSSGLKEKILDRHGYRESLKHVFDNDEGEQNVVRQFSLEDARGAFAVLCSGYALSFAVLIFEKIYHRFSENPKNSSDFHQILHKKIEFKN